MPSKGRPRNPRTPKKPDPLAEQLDQATTRASQHYAQINHAMMKSISLLKKGEFREAIHLAGSAAHNASALHRALIETEDIMVRMKKREEWRAQQLKLLENPDVTEKVV